MVYKIIIIMFAIQQKTAPSPPLFIQNILKPNKIRFNPRKVFPPKTLSEQDKTPLSPAASGIL